MQYSPDNEGGLLALVAALKGGMDPSVGTSMYGMIEQQQAQEVAQRQERLGGLASLLMGAAQGGTDFQGAEALAEAAPGPAGPAVQSMLSALYPYSGDQGGPDLNANGAVMDGPAGNAPTPSGFTPPQGPSGMQYPTLGQSGPTAQSPAIDPQVQMQQDAMMGEQQAAQQAAATEPVWGAVSADLANAKAELTPPDVAISQILASNPEVAAILSADPGRLQGMMEAIFGAGALKYAGAQPTIG
jgi:hypothetical protein